MPHAHSLKWTREQDPATQAVIFHLRGAMTDSPESYALVEAVRAELAAGARAIVLDCTAVELATSVGVGAIAASFSSAQNAGGALCLTALPERLLTLMKIVRLHLVIPIYPSVNAALRARGPAEWSPRPKV